MKNLAMHCHVKEQDRPIFEFLLECKEKRVDILSITDHKTLEAYTKRIPELTAEQIEEIGDLKIIIGLEMTGIYSFTNKAGQTSNVAMDILGYDLDPSKVGILDKFVKQKYQSTDTPEYQQAELERLIEIAKKIGFKADYDSMCIDEENALAGRVFANGLIDERFREHNLSMGLLPEIITNPRCFFNRYCKNPNSPFFLELSKTMPEVGEVIEVINKCGGKVFVPHTAAYSAKTGTEQEIQNAWEDSRKFTDDFVETYGDDIDGIEVIHPCYLENDEFMNFLRKKAQENGKYISGGTDYHKPGEELCRDTRGRLITDESLPGIEQWAKIYTIRDIIQMVKEEKDEERDIL